MNDLTLDPKFEELLRSVAADPASTLLRAPRPTRLHRFFDRADPGRISRVGRTSAERALLDTHRADLAWLLGEAALSQQFSQTRGRRVFVRYDGRGVERRLLSPEELRGRLDALPRDLENDRTVDAVQLLESCVSRLGGARPSPQALASLACAIQPTSRSRFIHASTLLADGECDGALLDAGHVLDATPRPELVASTWELVSVARARQGRFVEAHSAQVHGGSAGKYNPAGLMNRLVMAVQAGVTQDLEGAARALDEALGPEDRALEDYVSMTMDRRRAGDWSPTREGLSIAGSRWGGDRTGASRRIIDVFQ